MKKITLTTIIAISMAANAWATQALRDIRTYKQPDGTELQVIVYGDERMSITTDALTGECLTRDAVTGFWRPMNDEEVTLSARQWNEARKAPIAVQKSQTPKLGHIIVPVVPVYFSDLTFIETETAMQWLDTLYNAVDTALYAYTYTYSSSGKTEDYFTSGLRQYFRDQSNGKFDPEFRIFNPVTLDNTQSYYGNNSGSTKDANYSILVQEVVQKLKDRGDLDNAKEYDANEDGIIDLMHLVYAGPAESETGVEAQIWAKQFSRTYTTADGTKTGDMVLTSELNRDGNRGGIGQKAHEMSHALGLPDFYPTSQTMAKGCFGMDAWSVMDYGFYSGKGFVPNSYTLEERIEVGWNAPLENVGNDTVMVLEPLSRNGHGLILRNPARQNEYITLENHQPESLWDMCWGNGSYFSYNINKGLLITHVDYKADQWTANTVNNDSLHQRCNPLPADGELIPYGKVSTQEQYRTWIYSLRSDIFPGYKKIKTLNPDDNPKAVWFTGDKIDIHITDLKTLEDGSLEITFGTPKPIDTGIENVETGTLANGTSPRKVIMRKDGQITIGGYDLYGRKEAGIKTE